MTYTNTIKKQTKICIWIRNIHKKKYILKITVSKIESEKNIFLNNLLWIRVKFI